MTRVQNDDDDYLLVRQTDGPILGNFEIHAGPRGDFSVFSLGHDHEALGCSCVSVPIKLGLFATIEKAVQAISFRVEDQLLTWGLSFDTSD